MEPNFMKVYMVGGAIRDKLLNLPVTERDWVVVGATPDTLLRQGFRQVGKDFPVFLHPETNEEYALARTERKKGHGYRGFSCDFNPKVTLLQDLARRDLTINAMAEDEKGVLIDPFHGAQDLAKKCLRHVSSAFVEDPLRILRLARFAARFHHLGFEIAKETALLMQDMVREGEVAHLVPERIWQEIQKVLKAPNPEVFFLVLQQCGALKVLLPELDVAFQKGVEALRVASKLHCTSKICFAALMHEIPSLSVASLSRRLRLPNSYAELLKLTVRFHSSIQKLSTSDAEEIVKLLEQCDAFRRPDLFSELLLVSDLIVEKSSQCGKKWQNIASQCGKIDAKVLVAEGLKGDAIGKRLHQLRIACVERIGL